jgi:hypothetical protein
MSMMIEFLVNCQKAICRERRIVIRMGVLLQMGNRQIGGVTVPIQSSKAQKP